MMNKKGGKASDNYSGDEIDGLSYVVLSSRKKHQTGESGRSAHA